MGCFGCFPLSASPFSLVTATAQVATAAVMAGVAGIATGREGMMPAVAESEPVLGLEVVLLASPFSTRLLAALLLFAADELLLQSALLPDTPADGFDDVVMVTVRVEAATAPRLLPAAPTTMPLAGADLMVGVTVAEGLVDAGSLCLLLSVRGLIGVVLVEVPITLGSGAVFWAFVEADEDCCCC